MADPPAIPIPDDIVGAGTTAMVAQRPSSAPFLLQGRYRDVVDGWRAQLMLALRRLADESAASRLPTSEGDALKQLVASEYGVDAVPGPQAAIGYAWMNRKVIDTIPTHSWPGGTVPAGTRLRKVADPTASPPIQAAEYLTLDPVFFDATAGVDTNLGGGNYQHEHAPAFSTVTRIVATRPGPHANRLSVIGLFGPDAREPVIVDSGSLFDQNIYVRAADAAGGSSGFTDADTRTLARAAVSGQFGPNLSALIAGAMFTGYVKHVALYENTSNGSVSLWVADESWGYGTQMADAVKQSLVGSSGSDPSLGFGCKVAVYPVSNYLVGVTATVVLRDANFMQNATDITANIRTALRSYFDDRPDWYIVRLNSVAAAIASADRRILSVPSQPVVKDFRGGIFTDTEWPLAPLSATNPIPPVLSDPDDSPPVHTYLQDNGVNISYLAPQ